MATEVEFHPEAREEISPVFDRYAERSERAAEEFLRRTDVATGVVAGYPEAGEPYLFGTRRILVRRYPYMVVYREAGEGLVQVIALAHTSRRPGYWRDRL